MVTIDRARYSPLQDAFDKSRSAWIVLLVTAAFTGFQTAMLYLSLPPDFADQIAAGEPLAVEVLGTLVITGAFALISLVAMLFAWLMRSRIAMGVGLLLYGINWLGVIAMALQGQMFFQGILMNVVAPIFLVRSIWAASKYHALKKKKPVDPEVFA